jgi:cyclophilin family peptidyl-prolyl cis-trans isomerase/HEAT repeat protein
MFKTTCCLLLTGSFLGVAGQSRSRAEAPAGVIPVNVLIRIVRAEDERRWDNDLKSLLASKDANLRKRAALAAGRIGDERAVPAMVELLQKDNDSDVRQMAAFAIGEIESPQGADALIQVLDDNREPGDIRARAVEALGKIAEALAKSAVDSSAGPKTEDVRARRFGAAILHALQFEAGRESLPHRLSILLGLTAALRAKPEGVGPVLPRFLGHQDARIRADVFNVLARLRLKDGNDEARELLVRDPDPMVRANAARVLGATEDKQAFDALLNRALHDDDLRVRVSAIRALGSLKDKRAAGPLLDRGEQLLGMVSQVRGNDGGIPSAVNETLEIATTMGRVSPNSNDDRAIRWLRKLRSALVLASPEVEIAFARLAPQSYQIDASRSAHPLLFPNPNDSPEETVLAGGNARRWANLGQGLADLAAIKTGNAVLDSSIKEDASKLLSDALKCPPRSDSEPKYKPRPGDVVGVRCTPLPPMAVPDFLRAYAAFKPQGLNDILRTKLSDGDVIIRATAAELLTNQPPDEPNARALVEALKAELSQTEKGEMNDAVLAILDALAKQKSAAANDAIRTALDSSDHLIRRRAVALLKANGAGDFSDRIGTVKTRYTEADYRRALSRIGKEVRATVETTKGSFVIEFFPEDASLTVDNFIQLARKGFFQGQTIPRVVPNFVIQAGDPRGDTNGGPGYQIRCEINEVPYERGAVGMALSGKDTGGSQWFVTHSPQPHLDGGYTVFGRVVSGMDVVDSIARGDIIRRVTVTER